MMNHILEMSWIKQKTCWTLIHQRCNRPHEITANSSALCLIVKCSFTARTAHSCGSDPRASHLRTAAREVARQAPPLGWRLPCRSVVPLGQAAPRLKPGLLSWSFAWVCFFFSLLCACGSMHLINQPVIIPEVSSIQHPPCCGKKKKKTQK